MFRPLPDFQDHGYAFGRESRAELPETGQPHRQAARPGVFIRPNNGQLKGRVQHQRVGQPGIPDGLGDPLRRGRGTGDPGLYTLGAAAGYLPDTVQIAAMKKNLLVYLLHRPGIIRAGQGFRFGIRGRVVKTAGQQGRGRVMKKRLAAGAAGTDLHAHLEKSALFASFFRHHGDTGGSTVQLDAGQHPHLIDPGQAQTGIGMQRPAADPFRRQGKGDHRLFIENMGMQHGKGLQADFPLKSGGIPIIRQARHRAGGRITTFSPAGSVRGGHIAEAGPDHYFHTRGFGGGHFR